MEKFEIRAVTKYLQKKRSSSKEIHQDMVGVLGESTPFYQVVKNLPRDLKLGRQTYEHVKGAGRPVTVTIQENINRVHDMVMADRRMTIRRISEFTDF